MADRAAVASRDPSPIPRWLWALAALHCAATFVHFSHNAEWLADYPNLPAWLTRGTVYLAWLATAALGAAAAIVRRRPRLALVLLVAYGALGLAGWDHYARAAPGAHSLAMNLTINLEAATGLALAIAAVACLVRGARRAPPG